jgi:type II secretory pathway pseudopilin PulG
MGQQQLLLIILGVIIVGIAIAVGLQLFQSGSIGANSDALINDMMNIAAHADQYRIRPGIYGRWWWYV